MASQAFNNFRANLPPPAECLAILVGVAEVSIFGLAGLANPLEFSKGYGLPFNPASASQKHPGALESSEQEQSKAKEVEKTQAAYVAAIAARNIQNGVLLLVLGLHVRDRRALGTAIAAGAVTTVADTLIVQAYGVKEMVWGHAFGIFNCFAIGYSLLAWGREDPWL
jgi:hypothetical protein